MLMNLHGPSVFVLQCEYHMVTGSIPGPKKYRLTPNFTLVWLLIQTQLWGARHAGICSCQLRFEIKKNLIKMSLNEKNFFLPFVLDRKQTSGTQGPRRTPAGLWTKARPDCGSELWPQLQRTSHLQDNEESECSETCMFFPPHWRLLV